MKYSIPVFEGEEDYVLSYGEPLTALFPDYIVTEQSNIAFVAAGEDNVGPLIVAETHIGKPVKATFTPEQLAIISGKKVFLSAHVRATGSPEFQLIENDKPYVYA